MTDEPQVAPKFDKESKTLTIPEIEGVEYRILGKVVTGDVEIEKTTVVTRSAIRGYQIRKGAETEFKFELEDAPKIEGKPEDKKVDEPAPPVADQNAGNTPQNPAQGARPGPTGGNSSRPASR